MIKHISFSIGLVLISLILTFPVVIELLNTQNTLFNILGLGVIMLWLGMLILDFSLLKYYLKIRKEQEKKKVLKEEEISKVSEQLEKELKFFKRKERTLS